MSIGYLVCYYYMLKFNVRSPAYDGLTSHVDDEQRLNPVYLFLQDKIVQHSGTRFRYTENEQSQSAPIVGISTPHSNWKLSTLCFTITVFPRSYINNTDSSNSKFRSISPRLYNLKNAKSSTVSGSNDASSTSLFAICPYDYFTSPHWSLLKLVIAIISR